MTEVVILLVIKGCDSSFLKYHRRNAGCFEEEEDEAFVVRFRETEKTRGITKFPVFRSSWNDRPENPRIGFRPVNTVFTRALLIPWRERRSEKKRLHNPTMFIFFFLRCFVNGGSLHCIFDVPLFCDCTRILSQYTKTTNSAQPKPINDIKFDISLQAIKQMAAFFVFH